MDYDDAFSNAPYIPGGAEYPARWAAQAATFRETAAGEIDLRYGPGPRETVDIFLPEGPPRGTVIFVHGGYWKQFQKSDWSHLAAGPLAHGWAVALPGYDLCPAVRITTIVAQVRAAIGFIAARRPGPLRLVGHSAGGQLVARAMDPRAQEPWQARVEHVVPISPVADLAPLLHTQMNGVLRLDAAEAAAQSPVHQPAPACRATIWVGAAERPVFVAQADALAAAWNVPACHAKGLHHFNVIDGLARPASELTTELLR